MIKMLSKEDSIRKLLSDRQKLFVEMNKHLTRDSHNNRNVVNEYLIKVKIIDGQIKVLKETW